MAAVFPFSNELEFLTPRRPWLALYGVRLLPKTVPTFQDDELSLIQKMLPEEVMLLVLSHLQPHALGIASCVCRHWRCLAQHPKLWQSACQQAFAAHRDDIFPLYRTMIKAHRCSWKRMFLERPHLRFEGMYVARNTYVRTGVAEWNNHKHVHLVCYFRYYRFFPDGRLYYRTSPLVVAKVSKSMRPRQPTDPHVFVGRYIVKDGKVFCVVQYPNSGSTEVRSVLSMRSTRLGAHDRLDVISIESYDRDSGVASNMLAAEPADPEHAPEPAAGLARREYTRGKAPAVFVPWDQAASSPLNLPVQQMDFFVP